MVEWHHQFNVHELGQTPGDGEGQGSLACCSPRGHKESDLTHRLNKNNSVLMNRQLTAQHPRAAAIPCSCLWSKGMGGAVSWPQRGSDGRECWSLSCWTSCWRPPVFSRVPCQSVERSQWQLELLRAQDTGQNSPDRQSCGFQTSAFSH